MSNAYFQFKQFTIQQDHCAMKVTTDACLFGAWISNEINNEELIINNCLDIGTGTGLLSLMLAQKIPGVWIDAIEIDNTAAAQAVENVNMSPWKDRITVINHDVRSFKFDKRYDLIISNPPFYEKEIRSAKEAKNIAHHSDELKLKDLLDVIKNNLTGGGSFYLLLPYKRNEEIKELFKDHLLHIEKILFVRQSVKHDYFRIMLKGELFREGNEQTEFDEISIWDDKQQYTDDFVALLKDYYLYL